MTAVWLLALLLNPGNPDATHNPCDTIAATKSGSLLSIAGVVFKPSDFVSATEGEEPYRQERALTLRFSKAGNKKFIRLQQGKVGKNIPMCLGKSLVTDPILNEIVLGGEVQLNGNIDDILVRRISDYVKPRSAAR
jgi:preprotein translocase subunit SecD